MLVFIFYYVLVKLIHHFDSLSIRTGLPDFVLLTDIQIMQKQEILDFQMKISEKRLEIAFHFSKIFNDEIDVSDHILAVYFRRITMYNMLESVDVDTQLFLNKLSHTAWILWVYLF